MRTWKNVEVSKETAKELSAFLYDNNIDFESSACYDLVHFECNVNDYETDAINDFLDSME